MKLSRFLLPISLLLSLSLPATAQQAPPPPVDDETREAVVTSIAELVVEHYVFPEVGMEIADVLFGKLEDGAYDEITDAFELTRALTADLRSVNHDVHFSVSLAPPAAPEEDPEAAEARYLEGLRRRNYGFQRLEILSGNIGYLDLRVFADATHGGATAVAAMNFLANTDAVIVDLRNNGGGHPSMIQLILSYFFAEPTHVNSFFRRGQEQIDQFWTHAHVSGPRMTDHPLIVLTSGRTGSGAEEFAYDVKHLERGTVVGEVTAGGAHPGETHDAGHGFEVFISDGRAINPITGTNWERVGVRPNVPLAASAALDRGHLLALEAVLAALPEGADPFPVEWALDDLRARCEPVTIPVERLEAIVGTYGAEHTFELRDDVLWYSRGGGSFQTLLRPLAEDYFLMVDVDWIRFRFVRDGTGAVVRLVGVQESGQTLEAARD